MPKPLTTKDIDRRSEELIAEFQKHLAEFEKLYTFRHKQEGPINHSKVFEGWALQKIAGLQILVEHLYQTMQTQAPNQRGPKVSKGNSTSHHI